MGFRRSYGWVVGALKEFFIRTLAKVLTPNHGATESRSYYFLFPQWLRDSVVQKEINHHSRLLMQKDYCIASLYALNPNPTFRPSRSSASTRDTNPDRVNKIYDTLPLAPGRAA